MKCYQNHFGMIVSSVIALLMGIFMAVAIMIIQHTPFTWINIFETWGIIFLMITLILMIVPVNLLGDKFAKKIGLKARTLSFALVSNIIPSLIFNTIMSLVMPATGIFYNEAIPAEARVGAWMDAFVSGWLPTFVISYFCALVAAKIGELAACKTIGIPDGTQ